MQNQSNNHQKIFLKICLNLLRDREMSTTMALVRMLTSLLRDKNIAPKLVPIIPDEARTFGMEGFIPKDRYLCARRTKV